MVARGVVRAAGWPVNIISNWTSLLAPRLSVIILSRDSMISSAEEVGLMYGVRRHTPDSHPASHSRKFTSQLGN